MSRSYIDTDQIIMAPASAPGAAAIAVIRIAGPGCIDRLADYFSRPDALRAAPSHQAVYGRIVGSDRRTIDEVLALVFRSPAGYTGQDGVDILCHGGMATTEGILELLEAAGFAAALPGEFSFRAFVNGKLDLAKAEAVDELVRARTRGARANAISRLGGGLSRRIEAMHRELVRLGAACALRLDYGEDESPEDLVQELPALLAVRDECDELVAGYSIGRLLRHGARVVLAGQTNAGKSSLFNCLLKEERAIVSQQEGTTRDYVEAELDLGGFPVSLVDTAGLRDSQDQIEAEGMRRSRLLLSSADLVLYVVDAVRGLTDQDRLFIAEAGRPILGVWNKVDQAAAKALPAVAGCEWLAVSAQEGQGEPALVAAMRDRLLTLGSQDAAGLVPGTEGMVITSARQRAALQRASLALSDAAGLLGGPAELASIDMVAVDIQSALFALGEITGQTTSEDILDALFGSFCVGK